MENTKQFKSPYHQFISEHSKQYEGSGKTSREVLKNLGLLWRQKKLSREE